MGKNFSEIELQNNLVYVESEKTRLLMRAMYERIGKIRSTLQQLYGVQFDPVRYGEHTIFGSFRFNSRFLCFAYEKKINLQIRIATLDALPDAYIPMVKIVDDWFEIRTNEDIDDIRLKIFKYKNG